MSLFGKRGARASGYVPDWVFAGLEPVGRFEFDPQNFGGSTSELITNRLEFLKLRQGDPARFISEIAQVALPAGGWKLYGAFSLLWECDYLQDVPANPDATALLMAGVDFHRGHGRPFAALRIDERAAYLRAGGEPW